jgi:hypothetical protein
MGSIEEEDIETARQYYADLLVFEARMEAAGEPMHNRGRWLEAIRHLQQARTALEQFMGERMTADIRQAHETAQFARLAEYDDSEDVGGDS